MKRIVSFLVLAAFLGIPASASVLHVPGEYAAIQDAIDASVNGDTVQVAPGTYWGRVNFVGKRILLESASGPDSTIITAQSDSTPMIRFYSGEDSTSILRGFTIRGSSGIGITVLYSGPIIESNIIEDNANYGSYSPNHDGAAIYANQANCIIRNNVIRQNYSPGAGGGIAVENSTGIKIIGNRIISNDCDTYGGAIFLISCNDCLIERNLIAGNHAISGGGGIWFTMGAHNRIINNTIDSNYFDAGNYGSGVMLLNSDYNFFQNNIITGNYPGSGIEKRWGVPFSDTLIYSDLFGNSSTDFDSMLIGTGCISNDPMYVDQPDGDYNLLISSPCIDAGDPSSPLDLDGTIADMGAFSIYHRTLFYISSTGNDTTGYGSESSPFRTIQHGIDVSLDGDTVVVNDGHYYERISFKGKGIVLASRHLLDDDSTHVLNTIIDGDTLVLGVADTGSVVRFVNGEDPSSVLRGFTIRGGTGVSSPDIGGGIYCSGSGGPTISHCVITQNTPSGIYFEGGELRLTDSRISENENSGLVSRHSFLPNGSVDIDSCIFGGNGGAGISVFADADDTTGHYIKDCELIENHDVGLEVLGGNLQIERSLFWANENGGVSELSDDTHQVLMRMEDCVLDSNQNSGLRMLQSANSISTAINRCIFSNNLAIKGAAINSEGSANLTVNESNFTNNQSIRGGSLFLINDPDSTAISFNNCLFANNFADTGGVLYFYTDTISDPDRQHLNFAGCTFAQNHGDGAGCAYLDGGELDYPLSVNLSDCLIAMNSGGSSIACGSPYYDFDLSCTDIFGNPGGDWVGCIDSFAVINGNLSADPLFCDTASGDFTIRSTSPCAPANTSCNVLIGASGIGCYETSDFHLIAPQSDSVFVTVPNPFIWTKSSERYLGQDASYRFYIDDDSTFSSADSSAILTDTTYSLFGELTRSHRYYWKVLAFIPQADPKFSQETSNFYMDGYPGSPVTIAPGFGANADSGTALVWLAGVDPDPSDSLNYSLQIDDDSSFTSPIVDIPLVTPNTISGDSIGVILGQLPDFETVLPDMGYYWHVRANDRYGLNSDWSDWRYFIFLARISDFALIEPDSGTIVNSSLPALIWHGASHIDSAATIYYQVYWGPGSSLSDSSGQLSDTLFQIALDLPRSHLYIWQVKAFGPHTTPNLSSIWNFYINGVPSEPEIIEPPNGTYADLATNLIWYSSADPDSFDAVSYAIQIDDDSAFTSPEINQFGLNSESLLLDNAFVIQLGQLEGYSNLQSNTRYFWRLRADDSHGLSSDWTDGANWFFFMVQGNPPDAPVSGFSPSGGEEVISLTPTITWNDAFDPDPDDNGDNLSYSIRLSEDSLFTDSVYYDTTSPGINQIVPSYGLNDNSHYFYQIMTIDDGGLSSDWSLRQDFWTNHYNFPPEPFPVFGPEDGARQVVRYTQFYWGNTIDYDPNSSFTYSIQFSPDSGFNSIQWQLDSMADTAISIPTDSLSLIGGHLYWRITAVDDDSLIRIGGIPEGARQLVILPAGDANSSGVTNGLDVTFLVSYFKGIGPAPNPLLAGDANGDCLTNGLDVVYLVSYFKGSDLPPIRPDCEPEITGGNDRKKRDNR
jgi:hypothetical protein